MVKATVAVPGLASTREIALFLFVAAQPKENKHSAIVAAQGIFEDISNAFSCQKLA